MMSRREYFALLIAFITLIHASHADTVHAEESIVTSEEEHESSGSSSEESISSTQSSSATTPNPSVNQAQLAEDNKKASEELKEIYTRLEALKKDLDKANKAKDAKKITALKKEYLDKKEETEKKLNEMANQLEDRELPDGRVLPFSESGKKLNEELLKTAKLQKKINDTLKPLSDTALAKMQKDQDDLAKDKLLGTTAVGAAAVVGNLIAPGLGPLAAVATQQALTVHENLAAQAKPEVSETKPTPSNTNHVASKTEIDEPKKVEEKSSEGSEIDELASLQSVDDKAKAKEKAKIAEIAEKLRKTQERVHEYVDEGGLTDTGPDANEIWGLLQIEFKSSIDELVEISKANAGKPYSKELNKDIQNAINAVSKTTKLLATTPQRTFTPSTVSDPNIDSVPDSNPSSTSPNRIAQQPSRGSFAWNANEISNAINDLQRKPEPPKARSTPPEEESLLDWALRKTGEAYDSATNTISQWISSGSGSAEGQSEHQVVNNYSSDSGNSEPRNSSSSYSDPGPKSSSSSSSSTPSQSEDPKSASTPNSEKPKTSNSSPIVQSIGSPAQATANSGSGSGSGSGADARATGPQEQLTRRGIAPVGIENTVSHISPYESSERPSSDASETRVSSIPDTARQSSLRTSQDDKKNNITVSNLDQKGRLDESSVSFSARGNLSKNNSNGYSRNSQSSNNSTVVSETSSSSNSSQTQNGMQQGLPLAPQNALPVGAAQNGMAYGPQMPQEQFAGNGVQSLRRNINPNGVETYDGAKQTGSPLFTNPISDPEGLAKIPDKKNNTSSEKKPSVMDTAYATNGASGANPDFEAKNTVGEAVERAMAEDTDDLKNLIGKSSIEEVLPESVNEEKVDEKGLSTLAELAKFLEDGEDPVSNNRKIASKLPKKAPAKPTADLTASKASAGGTAAEQPQSFFSKILSLFGV